MPQEFHLNAPLKNAPIGSIPSDESDIKRYCQRTLNLLKQHTDWDSVDRETATTLINEGPTHIETMRRRAPGNRKIEAARTEVINMLEILAKRLDLRLQGSLVEDQQKAVDETWAVTLATKSVTDWTSDDDRVAWRLCYETAGGLDGGLDTKVRPGREALAIRLTEREAYLDRVKRHNEAVKTALLTKPVTEWTDEEAQQARALCGQVLGAKLAPVPSGYEPLYQRLIDYDEHLVEQLAETDRDAKKLPAAHNDDGRPDLPLNVGTRTDTMPGGLAAPTAAEVRDAQRVLELERTVDRWTEHDFMEAERLIQPVDGVIPETRRALAQLVHDAARHSSIPAPKDDLSPEERRQHDVLMRLPIVQWSFPLDFHQAEQLSWRASQPVGTGKSQPPPIPIPSCADLRVKLASAKDWRREKLVELGDEKATPLFGQSSFQLCRQLLGVQSPEQFEHHRYSETSPELAVWRRWVAENFISANLNNKIWPTGWFSWMQSLLPNLPPNTAKRLREAGDAQTARKQEPVPQAAKLPDPIRPGNETSDEPTTRRTAAKNDGAKTAELPTIRPITRTSRTLYVILAALFAAITIVVVALGFKLSSSFGDRPAPMIARVQPTVTSRPITPRVVEQRPTPRRIPPARVARPTPPAPAPLVQAVSRPLQPGDLPGVQDMHHVPMFGPGSASPEQLYGGQLECDDDAHRAIRNRDGTMDYSRCTWRGSRSTTSQPQSAIMTPVPPTTIPTADVKPSRALPAQPVHDRSNTDAFATSV